MPEGDAGSVHVQPLEPVVELPVTQDREHLRGERLVELDHVDVGQAETRALQRPGGGGDGTDAHRLRRHPGDRPRHQPAQRAEAELGGLLGVGDDARRRAVVLTAGVAGGHGGVGVLARHHRTQARERLEAGVRARVLVHVDDRVTNRHGHQLGGETTLPVRRDRPLV